MRQSFDRPARRPLPRQLDFSDWMPPSTSRSSGRSGTYESHPSSASSSSRSESLHSSRWGSDRYDSGRHYKNLSYVREPSPTHTWRSERHGVGQRSPTSSTEASDRSYRDRYYPDNRDVGSVPSRSEKSLSRRRYDGTDFRDPRYGSTYHGSDARFDGPDNQAEDRDYKLPAASLHTKLEASARYEQPEFSRRYRVTEPDSSFQDAHTALDTRPSAAADRSSPHRQSGHRFSTSSFASSWTDSSLPRFHPESPPSSPSSRHIAETLNTQHGDTTATTDESRDDERSNQSDNDFVASDWVGLQAARERRRHSTDSERQPSYPAKTSAHERYGNVTNITRTSSEQRAELYAFRKEMRSIFTQVEDMVDAHRDFFRTDPMSGLPVYNKDAQTNAEQLAARVFQQLSELRSRFETLASNFETGAPSANDPSFGDSHPSSMYTEDPAGTISNPAGKEAPDKRDNSAAESDKVQDADVSSMASTPQLHLDDASSADSRRSSVSIAPTSFSSELPDRRASSFTESSLRTDDSNLFTAEDSLHRGEISEPAVSSKPATDNTDVFKGRAPVDVPLLDVG